MPCLSIADRDDSTIRLVDSVMAPMLRGYPPASDPATRTGQQFSAGDRAAYALPPHGAYSQVRNYPAANLLKMPASLDHLDDRILAASMLKGLTVQYLVRWLQACIERFSRDYMG